METSRRAGQSSQSSEREHRREHYGDGNPQMGKTSACLLLSASSVHEIVLKRNSSPGAHEQISGDPYMRTIGM